MSKRKSNVSEELLLNKVVLRPEKTHGRPAESLGRPFEPFLATDAQTGLAISGWYFPADKPATVALINPSNRGTKAEALDHAALLLACGCSVLLYDYPGFGDSAGLADVRTLAGSARAVLDWARQKGLLPDGAKLFMVGLSLGSLVAIHLAAANRMRVAGLLLDGAIEPLRALRRSFGPLGAAVAEVACSQVPPELLCEQQIQSVTCPVLFVHGRLDTIGTVEEMQELAGCAKHATLWILDDCDHLDIITKHRDEYRRQLQQFLNRLIVR